MPSHIIKSTLDDKILILIISPNNIMLMTLFRWESRILNNIYKTDQFNKLQQLNVSDPEQIDYADFVKATNLASSPQEIIEAANRLCKPSTKPADMQTEVLKLNKIIEVMQNSQTSKIEETNNHEQIYYQLEHVIVYSCLSKCRIWPKVLKSGHGFVPILINFYNRFTKDFNQYLQFKFDPIILSQKYTKIMNKVNTRKKDNPKLIASLQKDDISTMIGLLLQKEIDRSLLPDKQLTQQQLQYLKQSINSVMHSNMAVTHIAVRSCNLQTIEFLGRVGADFQSLDNQKQTAIFYAVKRADMGILKFLVEQLKVNVNHREYQKRTPLYLAAFQGSIEIVDYLYKNHADPQLPSKLQRTPLSKACYLGNVNVVEYLLNLKVDILKRDVKGRTALHNAVWGIEGGRDGKRRGHIKLQDSPQSAELMIKAGHPVDYSDYDGFTPLFSAVSSRANRSLDLLLKYGASLSHLTNKQQTCVFIAAKYGHLDTIKLLIQKYNCEFTKRDIHGYNPLCASITLPVSDVFIYLGNLHLEAGYPLDLNKLLECCLQYDRLENWKYIWQWVGLLYNGLTKIQDLHHSNLPWLKKYYGSSQLSPQLNNNQTKKSIYEKLASLHSQLQKLEYFVPLLNNLTNKKKIEIDQLVGLQFQEKYAKIKYTDEQMTEDHDCIEGVQTTGTNIQTTGSSQEKKEISQLVVHKEIDPIIKTSIKATVPTISLKLPSTTQISSQLINFICVFIYTIFTKNSQLSAQERQKLQQQFSPLTIQSLIDCLCKHYTDIKRDNQFLIECIIILSHYGQTRYQETQIQINNFEISPKSEEKDIIKLMTYCQSNLTSDLEKVRKMLMRVVKYRLTGVLIFIYNSLQAARTSIGINKYSKQQLLNMLIAKNYEKIKKSTLNHPQNQQLDQIQQKLSLLEYCLVNGISDIYVYLTNILKVYGLPHLENESKEKKVTNVQDIIQVKIPNYTLKEIMYKQQDYTFTVGVVDDWVFNYYQVVERLSDRQKYVYRKVLSKQSNTEPKFDTLRNYQVITTYDQLKKMMVQIQPHLIIGIDTEHYDDKLKHFICSIQISVADIVYIIDPMSQANSDNGEQISQEDIGHFLQQLFNDSNKIKIFHAYENDLKWLNQDYNISNEQLQKHNFSLANIVDTGRMYTCLKSIKSKGQSIGLKTLGQIYLNYEMSKDFQRADWRIRPLFSEMLEYAAIDAQILGYIFLEQLKEKRKITEEEEAIKGKQQQIDRKQGWKGSDQIQNSLTQMFKLKKPMKSRAKVFRIQKQTFHAMPEQMVEIYKSEQTK